MADDRIDTTVAHPARRYDYWLGGKDNFQADRDSGDAIAAAFPTIRTSALENRRFLRRAVTYLAREAGIRQFLDIGTGIPSADNTHQVAQAVAPDSRIVYVDNDPIVLVHARALLRSAPAGRTTYIDADLRDPKAILTHPALRDTLDLGTPVALMLVAILHFVPDSAEPERLVGELVDAMPSGSYLTLTHATADHMPPDMRETVHGANARVPFQFRSRDELAPYVAGMDLVPPGIVSVADWHAEDEPQPRPSAADVAVHGVMARIP